MDTLKRFRAPITVVTVKGEVQTNEDKCMCMIVIYEQGHTYEWPSGREPRLTQNGKQTDCKTENLVPLVVPGPSSSSTTTHPRHRLEIVVKKLLETAAHVFLNGFGLHREPRDRRSS